jgi:anti-anti-sigma regulatory factor
MPGRELAQQSARSGICDSGLSYEIQRQGNAVWVTLSGILDCDRLNRLKGRVAPQLERRGQSIILNGRALCHLDYRAVQPLVEWQHTLRAYGHQLLLYQWSDYLKAILCMEDCEHELGSGPIRLAAWRMLRRAQAEQAP